ncbi:MAG: 4Fe-4S dicluster domain-containing protein [Chloroflexi bacterium]|nr:4Fe-4S dicluster domain-containing protein [Chloroflexota bacterium]
MDKSERLSRRKFLKMAAMAGGLVAIPTIPGLLTPLFRRPNPGELTTYREEAAAAKGGAASAATQRKVRQWMMVVDLRKCDGCVTIDEPPQCTQGCIQEHFVPDEQKWIQVYQRELSGGGTTFMPAPCYQCENAPCVNVCPVGATYHNEEGIVLINHERCIGCRFCMAACPYQRRFFNWGDPELPPEARFAAYSPEYPVPAIRGTVIKCMFCAHRASAGKLPACVEACPMNALYFGDLEEDVATNGVEVVQLSRFLAENNAFRYKEELGTRPRVWYIPGHGESRDRSAGDSRPLKPNRWWKKQQ